MGLIVIVSTLVTIVIAMIFNQYVQAYWEYQTFGGEVKEYIGYWWELHNYGRYLIMISVLAAIILCATTGRNKRK